MPGQCPQRFTRLNNANLRQSSTWHVTIVASGLVDFGLYVVESAGKQAKN